MFINSKQDNVKMEKTKLVFIILILTVFLQIVSLVSSQPMPPYWIDGVVTFNNEKVEGANIIAINERTGGSTSFVTNSLGEYIVDLGNLKEPEGFINGDKIMLGACYNNLCVSYNTTIQTQNGGEELNFNISQCLDSKRININIETKGIIDKICNKLVFLKTNEVYYEKCYSDIKESKFKTNESICVDTWPKGGYASFVYIIYDDNLIESHNYSVSIEPKNDSNIIEQKRIDCQQMENQDIEFSTICINNININVNNTNNYFQYITQTMQWLLNVSIAFKITGVISIGIAIYLFPFIIKIFRNKKRKV